MVAEGELHSVTRRLLSPSEAATYLGLTSRFAIYRLVASGSLPAVRLANKLRLDLRDLDAAIDQAKSGKRGPKASPARAAVRPRAVPRALAPRRADR
jgi:excisionase family DNA binding protein